MSYVIAVPEALAAAAAEVAGIGSTVTAANAAAAVPTTAMLAAGADEVSTAISALFNAQAQDYQALSTDMAVFHSRFVHSLIASMQTYVGAETANALPLQRVAQEALGVVTAGMFGGGSGGQRGDSAAAVSPAPANGTGPAGGGTAAPVASAAATTTTPEPTPSGAMLTASTGGTGGQLGTSTATINPNPVNTATTVGSGATTPLTASAGTTTPEPTPIAATLVASTGGNGLTATYTATSQWDSGYVANYMITNSGSTPMANWQLQFDLSDSGSITNLWNGQVAQSGTQYTVTPESYNGTIAPGESITVGFQAAHSGSYSPPTNVLLNGEPGSGGGGTGTDTGGGGGMGTGGAALAAAYTATSQWDSGYVANYMITNSGSTPMANWQLQFDLPDSGSITNLWNGQVSQSGTQYTVTPESYNGTIAPGESVTVGFQAAHSGSYSPPTNVLVNGEPVTVDQAPTNPPTTPPPPTSTGGTVISTQFGTTTVADGYVVQNNAWNNAAGQTISVSPTGFAITSISGSAPTNGAPLGYPSIFEGWHYGTGSVGTTLPLQLGQIQTATSSIDYAYPSTGIWNAAYDIWLDPTPVTTGVNEQEIMIWFNQQGPIQPVGSVVGNATVGGRDFVVWDGHNGLNNVMSYVSTSPIEAWDFDVMDFVDHTQTMEPITDSWYLTSIQAGFEPWSGGVGLGVDSFSANVT